MILRRLILGLTLLASAIAPAYGADRKPLVIIGGQTKQIPTGDTVPVANGGTGATSASAARTSLGVAIGTDVQTYDADLTTYAGITPSANVQSLLSAANNAAIRTALSLVPGTDIQAFDSDLSTYAGITPSANVQSLLGAANYSAMRTALTLVPGTDVQAYDADLTTWANVTPGTGVGTFLATPTSANLATAITNETGSGALVFGTLPTLTTPALGTPSAVVLTSGTGLPISTGVSGLGSGIATFLATPSSANLASALTDEIGSTSVPFQSTGTWTPAVKFGGASVGLTYSVQSGWYIRTGNSVTETAHLTVTAKGSSTGAFTIAGSPFTSRNLTNYNQAVATGVAIGTVGGKNLTFHIAPNSTTISAIDVVNASGADDADLGTTSEFVLTLTYEIEPGQ